MASTKRSILHTDKDSGVRSTDARDALLLAAERCLALHGLDGVSLNVIVKEAGQRNSSAVQYHFGDRKNLIREILKYRITAVNKNREDRYREVCNNPGGPGLIDLVEALVLPLSDVIISSSSPSYYVRFLEHLTNHSVYFAVLEETGWPISRGFAKVTEHIRVKLAHLPEVIQSWRIRSLGENMIASLANVETMIQLRQIGTIDGIVSDLVDQLVVALEAIPSEKTLGLIRNS
ncbi:regulatory protein TetR [Sphingobium chlorophenolicum L-1]|uniref:Regulatory protein TetR n=1 Tax=Sphingobium chlorophenolicum L-1 TaxID=690566 RepID=F6F3A7_SPHCR|nr:TetR family transcriptional regulator [Sphingobium chlorophenolicum]AEG50919.1 regulatory protein TetR [Sphingobium chlorophenolicum L-1]